MPGQAVTAKALPVSALACVQGRALYLSSAAWEDILLTKGLTRYLKSQQSHSEATLGSKQSSRTIAFHKHTGLKGLMLTTLTKQESQEDLAAEAPAAVAEAKEVSTGLLSRAFRQPLAPRALSLHNLLDLQPIAEDAEADASGAPYGPSGAPGGADPGEEPVAGMSRAAAGPSEGIANGGRAGGESVGGTAGGGGTGSGSGGREGSGGGGDVGRSGASPGALHARGCGCSCKESYMGSAPQPVRARVLLNPKSFAGSCCVPCPLAMWV